MKFFYNIVAREFKFNRKYAFGLAIIGLLFHTSGYGQQWSNNLSSNTVPPSPEAASLGKYGEVPVNAYTGIPQIGIPLFDITTKRLKLKTSLSYHAGGHKLEDKASYAGLGWSFMGGGVISRSMRGRADEGSGGFIRLDKDGNSIFPTIDDIQNNANLAMSAVDGELDTQPDFFHFNFMGYNGKIIFDQSGIVQIMPQQKFKIKAPLGKNRIARGWSILTDDGTEYQFQAEEYQQVNSGCGGGNSLSSTGSTTQTYISAWYLTKIISHDFSDEISIEYVSSPGVLSPQAIKYDLSGSVSEYISVGIGPDGASAVTRSSCVNQTKLQACYPKRISFDHGYINFEYSGRTDLLSALSLKRIGLYNNRNQQLKEFVLEHGYVAYSPNFTKLSLLSVKEQVSTFNPLSPTSAFNVLLSKTPYKLDYYEGGIIENSVVINAQDHWGYYNGKSNNTLIPTFQAFFGSTPALFPRANRQPGLDATRSFTLRSITYPTGGRTTFEYALNEVIEPGIPYSSRDEATDVTITDINNLPKEFTINSYGDMGGIPANINLSTPPCGSAGPCTGSQATCSCNNNAIIGGCNEIVIQKCQEITIRLPGQDPYTQCKWNDYTTFSNYYQNASCRLFIPDGRYRLIRTRGTGIFTARLSFFPKDVSFLAGGILSPNKKVGGLRISRIMDFGFSGDPNPVVKEYKYVDATGRSTGKLNYVTIYQRIVNSSVDVSKGADLPICVREDKTLVSSYPQMTLGATASSLVGYETVLELNGFDGLGGTTKYTYTSTGQFPDRSVGYPFGPGTSYEYKRGALLSKEVSKMELGTSVIVSQQTKSYKYDAYPSIISVKGLVVAPTVVGEICRQRRIEDYSFARFEEIIDWIYPDRSTERQYTSPTVYSEQVSEQEYSTKHFQLIREITYKSDKSQSITEHRYPADISPTTEALANMVNVRNIQNSIVETSAKVREPNSSIERLLSVSRNTYGIESGRIVKQMISRLENESPVTVSPSLVDLTVYKYDPVDGNLIQTKLADSDTYISYLWGYGGSYPIAEVRNATYEQIVTAIGNVAITEFRAKAPGTSQQVREKLNTLRTNLPGAMVTTYTYEPLVGMTSSTDPAGVTTTYEYDGFQRLSLVRDQDGNIVKQYHYNYRK